MTLLSAHTGAFIWSKSFDTWGSNTAGDELVASLQPFLFPLTAKSNEPSVFRERTFVLIVTVLDSGENGGTTLNKFFEDFMGSEENLLSLPGHRESWIFVAYIGETVVNLKSESHEICENCTGNILDTKSAFEVKTENLMKSDSKGTFDIVPVRKLIQCASSRRGMGPTMVKLSVPLIIPKIVDISRENRYVDIGESSSVDSISFHEIDMVVPSEAMECIEVDAMDKFDALIERLKLFCASKSDICGFVVTSSSEFSTEQNADNEYKAFLFSCSGFPLRRMVAADLDRLKFSRVFVMSSILDNTDIPPLTEEVPGGNDAGSFQSLKYVSLGGKHHPDTISFDTTLGLCENNTDWSNVALSNVCFSGGTPFTHDSDMRFLIIYVL